MVYIGQIQDLGLGYTQAGLNWLMALHTAGVDIQLFPLGRAFAWDMLPGWAQPLRENTARTGISRDVAVLHFTPDALADDRFPKPGRRNVGLSVVETDVVPRWICEGMNRNIDALITSSRHNAEAFRQGGFAKPIHVMPHAVGAWWWESAPAPRPADHPFVFYYIGGWNQRKNPMQVLEAYLDLYPSAETARKTGVALALKLTGPASLESSIRRTVAARRGQPDNPDVWVWTGTWSERQVRWLHDMGDCYVSAHRGEGWGYGLHQAALLGKQVVYTDWSAPQEFLPPPVAGTADEGRVAYRLTQIVGMDQHRHFDVTEVGELLRWAEPDHGSLQSQMVKAWQRLRRGPPTAEALEAYRNRYTWETVGQQFQSILEAVAR